jgi:membrane fusion protein (multidrug efflux system)
MRRVMLRSSCIARLRFATTWIATSLTVSASAGCATNEAHAEAATPAFQVTTVLREDTDVVDEYVCQIRAIQHIDVRALERGYLRDIFVDEGEHVHRGQHLFQILPTVYEAELQAASAEMQGAQIELQNTQMLRDAGVVSPQALALAQAHYDQSAAERSLSRAHLQFTSLDAPFDGIVGRLRVRRGSLLEEGEVLTVLADNSQMWVYFVMSEGAYLSYRSVHEVNDPVPVRLRLANGELFEQAGVIQTIEADFDNSSGTIAFRAVFPNPGGILRHGETGAIVLTTTLSRAQLIPQAATFRVLDVMNVYVVGDDHVVHARAITVGQELPHRYVVASGLRDGERVLIEGLRRVRDGDVIEPRVRDPHEVFEELSHLPAH